MENLARENNGQFQKGQKNSAGRPKGIKNQLLDLKHSLLDGRRADLIRSVFDKFLTSSNRREQIEVLKLSMQLLPREDKLQHEIASLVMNKTIEVQCDHTDITCPKCLHHIDLRTHTEPSAGAESPTHSLPDMGPPAIEGGGDDDSTSHTPPKSPNKPLKKFKKSRDTSPKPKKEGTGK